MAFVFEKLSKEQGKELSDKYQFKHRFTNELVVPHAWAVDKEANAFLVAVRGRMLVPREDSIEIPSDYTLVWNDKQIEIEHTGVSADATGHNYNWHLTKITAPLSLEPKKDQLIKLIKEAYSVLETEGGRVKVIGTFAKIAEPIFNEKE